MKKKLALTPEMNRALAILRENGCIVRYQGGFWQRENAVMEDKKNDVPIPLNWVHTATIAALASHGLIEVAYRKATRDGRATFPVKYILTSK